MHQLTTPEAYFAALVVREPSRPFVTYYDEATGERTELSVKSLANWVAKTHHLLATELGLGVGDTAQVSLPAHWLSVPVVLGCLSAGLSFSSSSPAVAFVSPGDEDAAALDTYVVTAKPSGEPGDYITAVRPQADAWASVHSPAGPDDACFDALTRAEVVERAAAVGLDTGARVLTTRAWTSPNDWIDTLFAPLVVGGSVVYVANCDDEDVLARRMSQERATTRLT